MNSLLGLSTTAIATVAYQFFGLWKTFDTVALMKAGAGPLTPRVKWRSYNAIGDSGGNEGYYHATLPSGVVVDEGNCFATAAGGYVIADTPPGNISLNRFGVIGAPDVTTAAVQFQRCNDFAYSIHREYETSPSSYGGQNLGQTVNITTACGPISGAPQIDGTNRGVYWQFTPTATGATSPANTPTAANDWMPMFTVSHANFYIRNLAVNGPTAYNNVSLVADGFVNAAKFQAKTLDALAPGYVGVQCIGSAKGTFSNCVTLSGLKSGFMYSTSTGHINQVDHSNTSLYGVFIDQNSEDYKFHGGGFAGGLGYLLMSTRLCAGHYGGCNAIIRDLHLGFTTRPISQLADPTVTPTLPISGFYGTIDGGSIEQIGEALIDVLDSAQGYYTISNCRISQSGFSSARPAAGNSFTGMCQVELDPVAGFQQYMLRLGSIERLNCPNSNFLKSGTTAAQVGGTKPTTVAACFIGAIRDSGATQDAFNFESFDSVVLGSGASGWNSTATKFGSVYRPDQVRSGARATKGDLSIGRDVSPSGNLLANPEARASVSTTVALTNWGSFNSSGTINGGFLSEFLALGTNPFANTVWDPRMFADANTDNPFIIKITAAAAGSINVAANTIAGLISAQARLMCLSLWQMAIPVTITAGATVAAFPSLRTNSATTIASQQYQVPINSWLKTKVTQFANVQPSPTATTNQYTQAGLIWNAAAAGDVLYVACMMLSKDEHAPYTPYPGATIATPLYLTNQTTGTAAPSAGGAGALPATPTGYKTEYINGIARQIAYY